ncbi:tyrosine--tRNA ligase [Inediibacterium massiliense]|uniref:tyrosine--tRNA ligase n=1 Tax=Inediibacterium massiliense TaxID=1658111 RepID=UPI0006B63CA2|nr:tyrosine--tRNA ligase [Inediibacterium massiliense]
MSNVFDVLKERGFIQQATHEDEIRELLGKESVTFYIGFDPTADSLHVGHFVQVITMMHMQRAGHRPIILIGGGTGMIGDPTGKTDMRKFMTPETVQYHCDCFKKQLSKFLDFSEGKAMMVNNGDWLLNLEYIPFLRDIGRHFSVNRMLTAECFKSRMERGLSFLEFNYMIMQSYDFLKLSREYNCSLELGGDDQWSNILGGVDLVRRVDQKSVYGMTFSLLTTSTGKKMGKTEAGALWLDPEKTSPYDFYQYWRNVDDADVEKCLSLLTFLPMDEVRRLGSLEGAEINKAKEILAFEITSLVHGEEEAKKAEAAAKALFGSGPQTDNIPFTEISSDELEGMDILSLLSKASLIPSRSEGRRLVQQGGVSINDEKITDINTLITKDYFKDNALMIKKGKKTYHQIRLK